MTGIPYGMEHAFPITRTPVRHMPLIAVTAFAVMALTACGSPGIARLGATAPDFTLPLHGGQDALTLSSLRGKVVLVNFWGSWCPPCKAELPDLVSLHGDYAERDFVLLGVLVKSAPTEVDQVSSQFGIRYSSVVGTQDIAQTWGVTAVPTTFILDREGVVRFRYEGPRNRTTFERDVMLLLSEN